MGAKVIDVFTTVNHGCIKIRWHGSQNYVETFACRVSRCLSDYDCKLLITLVIGAYVIDALITYSCKLWL